MDWQEITALLIVGATAWVFIWSNARQRKFSLKRDTHCGCGSAENLGARQSIRFSARKGARPQVIVKNL